MQPESPAAQLFSKYIVNFTAEPTVSQWISISLARSLPLYHSDCYLLNNNPFVQLPPFYTICCFSPCLSLTLSIIFSSLMLLSPFCFSSQGLPLASNHTCPSRSINNVNAKAIKWTSADDGCVDRSAIDLRLLSCIVKGAGRTVTDSPWIEG